MIKVSKEEVLYIAHLSRIALLESEVEPLRHSLEEILSYAARVQELAATTAAEHVQQENRLREDEVIRTDPRPLLAQVPVQEDNYVVVPAVLENEQEGAL